MQGRSVEEWTKDLKERVQTLKNNSEAELNETKGFDPRESIDMVETSRHSDSQNPDVDGIMSSKLQKMKKYCETIEKITSELRNKTVSQEEYLRKLELNRSVNSSHCQEIDKKNKEIDDYQKKVHELEKELQKQRAMKQKYQNQAHKLQAEIAEIAVKQRRWREKLRRSTITVQTLTNEIKKLRISLKELSLAADKYQFRSKTCLDDYFPQLFLKIHDFESQLSKKQNMVPSELYQQQRRIQLNLLYTIGIRIGQSLQPKELSKMFESQMIRYIKYRHTFSNSEVITQLKQKVWLFNQIQPFLKGTNFESKLLFKLDKLNTTNFHKYIDGKFNLLVVVKLVNGLIVGGYSHSPIQKERADVSSQKGFLFSLDNLRIYSPKADNQYPVVSYDDYFLIIGNSELRIRVNEKKIYSHFGVSNGIFNTDGRKVIDFLGVQAVETELETYEIYQVISK